MPSRRVSLLALFAVLGTSLSMAAQQPPAVASLIKAEAGVTVGGQPVVPGAAGIDFTDPAEIQTTDGRAVVALKRGGVLVLGPQTSIRLHANHIYNFNRIEVLKGAAVMLSGTSAPVVNCGTETKFSDAAIVRFDVLDPERMDGTPRCRVRLYEGAASTPGASLTYVLRGGQQMVMNKRAGDMIPVNTFDAGVLDDLDRWARGQIR